MFLDVFRQWLITETGETNVYIHDLQTNEADSYIVIIEQRIDDQLDYWEEHMVTLDYCVGLDNTANEKKAVNLYKAIQKLNGRPVTDGTTSINVINRNDSSSLANYPDNKGKFHYFMTFTLRMRYQSTS